MSLRVRLLAEGDEGVLARVADGVFDEPIRSELLRAYLAEPRFHLAVAIADGVVVGVASAVDYFHPDKPPELWINEVAVATTHHRQGIARRLLKALFAEGRRRGCVQAWVLTNRSNLPATALYRDAGGVLDADDTALFTIPLGEAPDR